MKIESSAFKNGEPIPKKYTCDAEDINPPLSITDIPPHAVSLALIVDDPDAPGGTWVHWTVWDIAPAVTEIPENAIPDRGIEGYTSAHSPGYRGPCPPSGLHRYFFKVYALNARMNLPQTAHADELLKMMHGHIVADAKYMGTYTRE